MRLSGWFQDALDLLEMIDIVSGYHADDVLDGFLAALGMLTKMLPLVGLEGFEEREIRIAYDTVLLDGFAGIALFIVPGDDPRVLIEGLDGSSGGSEDGAHAPGNYDFYVGEVGEYFGDGPLAGGWALAKFRCRYAFDQASELLRG